MDYNKNVHLPVQTKNPWSFTTRDFVLCGANGTRTRDPHTASVVRYQLRHSPSAFRLL